MSVKVESHLKEFTKRTIDKLDDCLLGLAGEIERDTKKFIPHRSGSLQSSISVNRKAVRHYTVSVGEFPNLPYATFMEFGEHYEYSEPGKKPHALRDAGERVNEKSMERIKRALV